MKAFYYFFLFIPFILLANLPPKVERANKLALIIAVSKYPPGSGWNQLSSENDARLIKETLIKQGFRPKNIIVIQNEKATLNGIENAIKKYLIQKVRKGDIAVFHFSGHGQQIQDFNEDEEDGYDEALVPYDSPKHFQSGKYEGENLLTDDRLGILLNKLRKKLGNKGHLFVLIDACHSGTATRGFIQARGTNIRMASQDYISANNKPSEFVNDLVRETQIEEDVMLANLVAFFSSAPNQLSYECLSEEGESYGILSYTFAKAFVKLERDATYQKLFDQIRQEISALSGRQNPHAEGQLDKQVFGGQVKGYLPYFLPAEYLPGGDLRMASGSLEGLFEGTKLAFYPVGTRDTTGKKAAGIGTIEYSTPVSCIVRLDSFHLPKSSKNDRLKWWAFVKEKNYGKLSVTVFLNLDAGTLKNKLLETGDKNPVIRFVNHNAEINIEEKTNKVIQILTADDRILESIELLQFDDHDALADTIEKRLLDFARSKFLRKLEVTDPRLDISLEFLDAQYHPYTFEELRIGEPVSIRVYNNGSEAFYFSIIDITPRSYHPPRF